VLLKMRGFFGSVGKFAVAHEDGSAGRKWRSGRGPEMGLGSFGIRGGCLGWLGAGEGWLCVGWGGGGGGGVGGGGGGGGGGWGWGGVFPPFFFPFLPKPRGF